MAFDLDIPDLDDAAALADWIEFFMLSARRNQVSRAEMASALGAPLGMTPQDLEIHVESACREIGRRARVIGPAYPLTNQGPLISCNLSSTNEFYVFLLLISVNGPMRQKRRFMDVDEFFDLTVELALTRYLGDGSSVLRFAWPSRNGRPKKFNDALVWLSDKTGLPVGAGLPAPALKDGGVDLVAWKPFRDKRTAFLVLYAQCTMKSDWHGKAGDIFDLQWLARLDTGLQALKALAIPFVIPKGYEKWDDLRRAVHVVFDRVRLMQLLESQKPSDVAGLPAWITAELKRAS